MLHLTWGNYGLNIDVYFTSSGSSADKESPCNVGDLGSITGLGRFPGEGTGTHSTILAWKIPWAEEPGGLRGVTESQTRLSHFHFHFTAYVLVHDI